MLYSFFRKQSSQGPLEDKVQRKFSLREPRESLCEPIQCPCNYKMCESVNKTQWPWVPELALCKLSKAQLPRGRPAPDW